MAQLDTRIPMQVPNVLAQQAQVTQNNRLAAQSLGEGFNAVQRGMEAPMRRNMLAAQVQNAGIQNTQQEQAMLGQVLDKVAAAPETWGAARQFLVGNGIFEEGELPEQLTEQTFRELSAVAFTPVEELTDYQRKLSGLNSPDPRIREASEIALNMRPGAQAPESYTLSPGQVRVGPGGNVEASVPANPKAINAWTDENGNVWDLNTGQIVPGMKGPQEGPKLSDQAGLRKEWAAVNKDFVQIRDSYVKVQDGAVNPSAAGDLALIFNYMKMLDPGSVVREGEFATAQNAAGVDDRIRNIYNQVLEGTRLNPEQRADFAGVAKRIYDGQLGIYNQNLERYRGIAEAGKMDPMATIPDITLAPDVAIPPPPPPDDGSNQPAASDPVPPPQVGARVMLGDTEYVYTGNGPIDGWEAVNQ